MKKVLFLIVSLFLCSCGDEYKAAQFTKKIEADGYTVMCQNINEDGAYIYYKDRSFNYYKYDVRIERRYKLFSVNESDFICESNHCEECKVFYLNDQGDVMCYDLIRHTKVCVNNNGEVKYELIRANGNHIIFFDHREGLDCNKRVIYFNAHEYSYRFVKFSNIEDSALKDYTPTCICDNGKDVMMILRPLNPECDRGFGEYLYYYALYDTYNNTPKLLCRANEILCGELEENKVRRIVAKTNNMVYIYDSQGRSIKEFATINAWPVKRGLTPGNIIAYSAEENILCYVTNNPDDFLSSVDLYYYDGNTGEEVELDQFTDYAGNKRFLYIGSPADDIKVSTDGLGLVFYGIGDGEYSLLRFYFQTRQVKLIDRGNWIEFIEDRFKVTHHNNTEAWYNTNGQQVRARTWVDDWSDSVYDAGAELGSMLNALF